MFTSATKSGFPSASHGVMSAGIVPEKIFWLFIGLLGCDVRFLYTSETCSERIFWVDYDC